MGVLVIAVEMLSKEEILFIDGGYVAEECGTRTDIRDAEDIRSYDEKVIKELREENERLREENEQLEDRIRKIQSERVADAWKNAMDSLKY